MTLDVERLGFGHGARAVGREVSFTVKDGEVLCLLGSNGAGKTTLLRTLLGLLPAQAGRILYNGENVAHWPQRKRAQAMAYVPQASNAVFPFTVRDIALMGRAARIATFDMPGQADHAATDDALATLGIGALASRPYTDISGGERQLALIARALAQEPRVLVMDEPTANLDFGNQTRVLSQVRALAAKGIAVVLSTHNPDHAFLCADRVAMLHGGGLLALGAPDDVITAASLKTIYGVGFAVAHMAEVGRRICAPIVAPP